MITDLFIYHFRSIDECWIRLRPANIFVGKNGSGKSNVLDAISFLNDIISEDLDFAITKRHGSDSVRQWSKYKPFKTTIQINVERPEGVGFYKLSFSSSRNSYRVQEEVIEWVGEASYSDEIFETRIVRDSDNIVVVSTTSEEENSELAQSIKVDGQEAILTAIDRNFSDVKFLVAYIISEIRSFGIYSIFPNTIRSPQSVSRAIVLESDGKNIASVIKMMTGDRKRLKDRIIKSLKVVMPQLSAISIKSAAGYYVPTFSVDEGNGDVHELNMSQISDGTLRMLGILTAFNQLRAPLKIALEEPEQMVHPALLVIVRDCIYEFLNRDKNRQVFITTHSPTLLDLFDPEDVIAVEISKGVTRAAHIAPRQLNVVKQGLLSLGEVLLAQDLDLE